MITIRLSTCASTRQLAHDSQRVSTTRRNIGIYWWYEYIREQLMTESRYVSQSHHFWNITTYCYFRQVLQMISPALSRSSDPFVFTSITYRREDDVEFSRDRISKIFAMTWWSYVQKSFLLPTLTATRKSSHPWWTCPLNHIRVDEKNDILPRSHPFI